MLNGIPFNFCYQTTQCSSIGHTIIILLPCTLIIRCYNQTYLLLIVHPKHVLRRHDLFSDWQLREFTDHASTRRQLSLRALIMVNFSGGRTQVNLYHQFISQVKSAYFWRGLLNAQLYLILIRQRDIKNIH